MALPKAEAPYSEPIKILTARGVIKGMPDGDFHSEMNLTTEQMCIMLCRVFGMGEVDAVQKCYENGWVEATALSAKDSPVLYQNFYKAVFSAFKVPVYSAVLYGDEVDKSIPDTIRVAKQFNLPTGLTQFSYIARGPAAMVFYRLMGEEFEVSAPSIAEKIKIVAPEDLMLNDYLIELNQLPSVVLSTFQSNGWTFHIDSEHLTDLARGKGSCVGATSYSERAIYVSEAQATLHEFGHFVDSRLGFPSKKLFGEVENSGLFLRMYAKKSEREYFAEVFAFWMNSGKKEREEFGKYCPMTYRYFVELEKNEWGEIE